MNFTARLKMISNIYFDYSHMDRESDLRKRGLTLYDFNAFPELLKAVQNNGEAFTISTSIANYFKKFGFRVALDAEGVNYRITFQ